MGKCRVCLALKREAPKQASMYGKDEQSGRMMRIRCSDHKEALDVTRTEWEQSEEFSQRDARKRPKLGNQMRLPIDLESLPDKPAIVVSMKPDWLADQMGELTFTQVVEGSNIRWQAATKKVLDLTSQQPERRQVAADVMRLLVRGDQASAMAECVADVANIINSVNYNADPAFGAVAVGNRTLKHQHAPFGVFNMCGAGTKEWKLWEPGSAIDCTPPFVIKQGAGDLLWIPPGWPHEVFTTGGTMINRELNAAFHWVGWCMPRRLVHESLAALGCGVTHEDQCRTKVQHASTKFRIYRAMTQYHQSANASEIVPVADHPPATTAVLDTPLGPLEIAAQQKSAEEQAAKTRKEEEEKDKMDC